MKSIAPDEAGADDVELDEVALDEVAFDDELPDEVELVMVELLDEAELDPPLSAFSA